MTDAVRDPGNSHEVLTKFESVKEVAYFLALKWIWNKIPTLEQIRQYCRADGAYFCALEGCELVGAPQRGKDSMVTIGPLVFCHAHGLEVLQLMRQELGVKDEKLQWYYLSKTLHNAGVADERAAAQAQEDGAENRRAKQAAEEIETRWVRLNEARDWGPRHADYIARQKVEEAARTDHPDQQVSAASPVAQPPEARSVQKIPSVEAYAAMTNEELEEAHKAAGELIQMLESERDRLGEEAFTEEVRIQHEAQARIAEARKRKALARIAELKGKVGIRMASVPTASVSENPLPETKPGQASHRSGQPQNGVAGSADDIVAFVRKIQDGAWVQRADKRGTPDTMEYQCVVARNLPHACSAWSSAERMKIVRAPNGQVFFGICTVCAAIACAAGVQIEKTTLEQALMSLRPARERGGEWGQRPVGPNGKPVRHTGKTAREREKARRKAPVTADGIKSEDTAAAKPAKPDKAARRTAKEAAKGRR